MIRNSGVVVLIAAGLLPAFALATAQRKCGPQVYLGCDPGQYSCTTWTGYPCQTLGFSTKKRGEVFLFQLCVTDVTECANVEKICQRDIYYFELDCTVTCADYNRYVSGC